MARFGRNRPKAVVPLADAVASSGRRDTQSGSLSRALAGVERLGVTTPVSYVVIADVFRHIVHTSLPPGHDPASLLRTAQRPVGIERAARARERLLVVPLEDEVERELDAAFRALSESAPWGIAVRASAVLTDQGFSRAAGLAGTELPVFERATLGAAVRRAWARAASETTLQYLRARKIRDVALAVVLQPVVPVLASLTLVTDSSTVTEPGSAEAALGPSVRRLAVALAGLSTEDAELVDAEVSLFDTDGLVHSTRPLSQRAALLVKNRALARAPLREAGIDGPLLPRPRIHELSEIARRLEPLGAHILRCAVPARGDIVVVDARPAHHFGYPTSGTAATLWSRAAVTDAPAEPLTLLSRQLMARPLLERARLSLGRSAPRANRPGKLQGLLSTIDGRPYVNLSRVLDADGEGDAADAISRIELADAQWTLGLVREPTFRISLARAGLRVAQLATEQRALADEVGRFERDADQQRRWLAEMDLAILPDDALTTTLHEVYTFLSRAHEFSARADVLALAGHGLLASVLGGVDTGRASWLAHVVTSGADVVTARPAAAFCHVAAIARFDTAARERIVSGQASALRDLPGGPLQRGLARFLEAFGDRGPSEAELGSPRWGEQADSVFAMLAASFRGDAVDPEVALSRARALADRQLALLEPSLSFFETKLVRDIVSRQRDLLRLRERCRTRVAHGLAMMRVVALDVDRRIRRLDPTLEPGDALLLTLEELRGAVAKYRADLSPIVRARRADFESQRRTPEPLSVFRGVPEPVYPVRAEPVLKGLSASAGVGEGKVVRLGVRLEGLERFSPGDVLVVSAFDLGLSPLFFHAKAIVAELGTPFSSSSVVARDCGVPAVTGVVRASVLLRDGERVRVDGDAGTVELLDA